MTNEEWPREFDEDSQGSDAFDHEFLRRSSRYRDEIVEYNNAEGDRVLIIQDPENTCAWVQSTNVCEVDP